MRQSFAAGVLAGFLAVIAWGVQLPVAKDAFDAVDPFHVTLIRYAVATIFLVPVLALLEGPGALSCRGRAWPATLLGVTGMCASPVLVFLGMSLSRAEHAVVIVALQPSITALAQWFLRGMRPANFTIGCIALAFVGVVLVVTRADPAMGITARELLGDVLVLGGACCWVAYTLGAERLAGWSTLRVTVLTLIPGAIASLLVVLLLLAAGEIRVPTAAAVSSVGWELAYLAFVGVLFAMLAWNFGIQRIGALNSMLLINMMPVATFVVRALQGHRFAAVEVGGAAMVVAALVANNIYLRSQRKRAARAG